MKLGLFLTPGAAMSAYEVGAVRALVNEGGLHFDVIAGSSAGSLNGAFVAMGEIEQLARLWSSWHTSDVLGVDWVALLRGAVFWAPDLMQEKPLMRVIEQHIDGKRLQPGICFRFNLANLTTADQEFFEWPGTSLMLADGVKASVSVPAVIQPYEMQGMQWGDGLTVDGFPLEQLVLETGVERVFVVGVAPRMSDGSLYTNVYQIMMRAMKLNQFSETFVGIERAEETNALIQSWEADRNAVEQAVVTLIADPDLRSELLAEIEHTYAEAAFPYTRSIVQIVPILPEQEINMFFGDYQPERSRRLLEQGYQDALRVLQELDTE